MGSVIGYLARYAVNIVLAMGSYGAGAMIVDETA
jgi:hypothetical protein